MYFHSRRFGLILLFNCTGKDSDQFTDVTDNVTADGTLVINSVTKTHEGVYMCEANNNVGPPILSYIRLNVQGKLKNKTKTRGLIFIFLRIHRHYIIKKLTDSRGFFCARTTIFFFLNPVEFMVLGDVVSSLEYGDSLHSWSRFFFVLLFLLFCRKTVFATSG